MGKNHNASAGSLPRSNCCEASLFSESDGDGDGEYASIAPEAAAADDGREENLAYQLEPGGAAPWDEARLRLKNASSTMASTRLSTMYENRRTNEYRSAGG